MLHKTLFLTLITFSAFAQNATVRGKITDAKTGEPLPFANVYINRTTLGSATAMDGTYSIAGIATGNAELIVSLVGYETKKTSVIFKSGESKTVDITLKAVETQLSEITVTAKKDKQWARHLEEFKKGFLGRGPIAEQCDIQNPEVLDFVLLKGNGLIATAATPLTIINKALGYKVTYELAAFELYPQRYQIGGNVHFESLNTTDSTVVKRWIANRESVYQQSPINLYKAFVTNRLEENGYELYKEKSYEEELRRTDLFSYVKPYLVKLEPNGHVFLTDSGTFVIDVRTRIEVHDKKSRKGKTYRDVAYPVSWIELSRPLILSGFGIPQNPLAVQVIGAMSELRVAHLLPENYVPGKPDFKALAETKNKPLADATETIIIHTDRDYYNPGDPVWLKGYLQYGRPELADSMSRCVYVELIDTTKAIISRKVFPIRNATFDGRINIPKTSTQRYYALSAYTNWMRNYSEQAFCVKPLAVIDPYERVERATVPDKEKQEQRIVFSTDREHYQAGDSITMRVECLDAEGSPVMSSLSVSVTDYEFVKPITPAMAFHTKADVKSFQYVYPIEKRISITGQVTAANKKNTDPLSVTAVLGKFEDVHTFKTNSNGSFFVTGFQFSDSSGVALQSTDKKGKPLGKIKLEEQKFPEVLSLPPLPEMKIVRSRSGVARYGDLESDAIQLKEVTVTAKRDKYKDMRMSGDFSVDGDYIRSLGATSVMNFLSSGRLRRVRVRSYVDDTGFYRTVVEIIGMTRGGVLPLLVVDGVAFDTQQDVASIINQVNLNEVERIEVLTGASTMYGVRGAGGVIVITTRAHDGSYAKLNPNEFSTVNFTKFPLYGYASFKPFKQSSSSEESGDRVSTIFWEPYVFFDGANASEVKFRASSPANRYRVIIKGMTINGDIISHESVIELK